ncbi:MAG: hypothetical protein VYD64_05695 [Pseudomonadota bacterium]|nr:hypothetical protein [Pseudomonadota bacterium]
MTDGDSRGLQHGGALDRAIAAHGGNREDWLDLSTGINPIAWPSPSPMPNVPVEAWHRLPDERAEARLLAAARKAYRVPQTLQIVASPGSQALIEVLPRLLPGRTATVIAGTAGTYGEHARCC